MTLELGIDLRTRTDESEPRLRDCVRAAGTQAAYSKIKLKKLSEFLFFTETQVYRKSVMNTFSHLCFAGCELRGSRDQFPSKADPAVCVDEGGNRIFLEQENRRGKYYSFDSKQM